MVYRRSSGNIRKPARRQAVRRRAPVRRRASVRRAPVRRRARAKRVSCCNELTPAARFAIAQLDPFEPAAVGAKVPDSNTMPSLANVDTDIVSILAPSLAGGPCGMAFAPSYTSATLDAITAGAATVSWPNLYNNTRRNAANVINSIEAIRPVAHAIRISSPLAPTSATGFVHIGISVESNVNDAVSSAMPYPTSVNEMAGLAYYKRVTLASLTQSPLTVINKWIDDTGFRYDDPRSFYAQTTSSSTADQLTRFFHFQNSWGVLIILVDGQQSTTVSPLSVEHILHTEALPKKNAFILGTPAAPSNPSVLSSVSGMTSEHDFAHTEAQQETYTDAGLRILGQHANQAGERAREVLTPVAQRLASNAMASATNYAIGAALGYAGISGVNNQSGRLAIR